MKLTKKNKELVKQIVTGFISAPIIAVLTQDGHELTEELLVGINHAASMMDTTELEKTVAEALAANIEFKELDKVNKFLALPSTQKVLHTVQSINTAVSEVVNDIAGQVLQAASQPQEATAE
jgi:hypothetical protein